MLLVFPSWEPSCSAPPRKRLLGKLVLSPHHSLVVQLCSPAGLTAWAAALGIPVFWERVSCLGSVGTPAAKSKKLNPQAVTATKGLAVLFHDLGNVALEHTIWSCNKQRWRKKSTQLNINNNFVPQIRQEVEKKWDKKALGHLKGHWNKRHKHRLSFSWIPGINSKRSYPFHVTIFQPRQIRRTRNRDVSWGWVRPADKLIKCPITIYSWREKQIEVLHEVVQTTDRHYNHCILF